MTPHPTLLRRRQIRLLPAAGLLALVIAATLVLAGCSAGAGSSDMADGSAPMAQPASDGDAGGGVAYEESGGDMASTAADPDLMVVVTGYVTVVVDDPVAKAAQVAGLVEAVGGRISQRSQQLEGDAGTPYASLTARIPADEVSGVLDKLAELGTIDSSQLDSVEVTAQAQDLDARIRAMEISVARLEDLLSRSGELSDIVQAEQVLTDRQSQLEQLQSQRAALADQVSLSTVTINLYTDEAVPDEPPTGFMTGLTTGWKALVSFVTWLLGAFGVLLPWLALLGALALAAFPLVRRNRRRSAERAAARGGQSGPTTSLPARQPMPVPAPPAARPEPPAGPDAPQG